MFFVFLFNGSGVFNQVENTILTTLSEEEIQYFCPKILYTFEDFKQDIKHAINILDRDENYDIYRQILENYLKNVTLEDFVFVVNRNLNSLSSNIHKTHNQFSIIEKLVSRLKFLIDVLNKLQDNNLLHEYMIDIILNPKYGLFTRISSFFEHKYKCIFLINIIEVIAIGIRDINISSEESMVKSAANTNQKSILFLNFLKKNLNISNTFELDFLKIEFFLKFHDIKTVEHIKKYDIKIQKKGALILECINAALFGAMQEALDTIISKHGMNFAQIMFKEKAQFDIVLRNVLQILLKFTRLAYPEEDLDFVAKYLGALQEKFNSDHEYLNTEFFFSNFVDGFFKYVAFSSLTSAMDFPEILGKSNFFLPIQNLSQNIDIKYNKDSDLYSFIKSDTGVSIHTILKDINNNKLSFFLGKILAYRLENTYFKIFGICSKSLPLTIEELRTIFLPTLIA